MGYYDQELISLLLSLPILALLIADLKLIRKYENILVSGVTEFQLIPWIKKSLIGASTSFILSLLAMLISLVFEDPDLIATLFFISIVIFLGILLLPWIICGIYLLINLLAGKNSAVSKKPLEAQTEKKKIPVFRILFWVSIPVTIIIANLLDSLLGFFVFFAALGVGVFGIIAEFLAYWGRHPQEMWWVSVSLFANAMLAFVIYFFSIMIFNGWHHAALPLNKVYVRLAIISIIELAVIITMNVIIYIKSKREQEKTGVKTKYVFMILTDLVVYAVLIALLIYLFTRNVL